MINVSPSPQGILGLSLDRLGICQRCSITKLLGILGAGTTARLVCVVIFPLPQSGSHFGMVLAPIGAACTMPGFWLSFEWALAKSLLEWTYSGQSLGHSFNKVLKVLLQERTYCQCRSHCQDQGLTMFMGQETRCWQCLRCSSWGEDPQHWDLDKHDWKGQIAKANVGTLLVPADGPGTGEGNGSWQLLHSWRSPFSNPVPWGLALRWVNDSPSHMPQAFVKSLLQQCLCWLFVMLSLKGQSLGSPLPSGISPNWTNWLLKFRALSTGSCKNSQNLTPLVFKAKCSGIHFPFVGSPVWGTVSLPSLCLQLPCSLGWPKVHLEPHHIFTIPTIFDVTSSLPCCGFCSADFWVIFWVIYTDGRVSSCVCGTKWV